MLSNKRRLEPLVDMENCGYRGNTTSFVIPSRFIQNATRTKLLSSQVYFSNMNTEPPESTYLYVQNSIHTANGVMNTMPQLSNGFVSRIEQHSCCKWFPATIETAIWTHILLQMLLWINVSTFYKQRSNQKQCSTQCT